jgi:hypothetical protein
MQTSWRWKASLLFMATLGAGCESFRSKIGHSGTLTCSCSATGCQCKHCTGESSECRCRATDAYPDGRIGTPDGY